MQNNEYQYLNLLRRVIDHGAKKTNRTETPTRSLFGPQMRFSLKNGVIPLLTTKRIFWRAVVEELLWFISGSTDSTVLASRGVKIWDANGSRTNLDSMGFVDRATGDLGPIYGFQWRHYGAKYTSSKADYQHKGEYNRSCIPVVQYRLAISVGNRAYSANGRVLIITRQATKRHTSR